MGTNRLKSKIIRIEDLLPRVIQDVLWTSETDKPLELLKDEAVEKALGFSPGGMTSDKITELVGKKNQYVVCYDSAKTLRQLEIQWESSFQGSDIITRRWAGLLNIFENDFTDCGAFMLPIGKMPFVVWDLYIFGSVQRTHFYILKTQIVQT